jgi:hypothetical protein
MPGEVVDAIMLKGLSMALKAAILASSTTHLSE